MKHVILIVLFLLSSLVASCSPRGEQQFDIQNQESTLNPTTPAELDPSLSELSLMDGSDRRYGYLSLDGNHLIDGGSDLDFTVSFDLTLPFQPSWLVGISIEGGSAWLVVGEEGEYHAFALEGEEVKVFDLGVEHLAPGTQPSIFIEGDQLGIINPVLRDASPASAPVYIDSLGSLAYLDGEGDLVFLSLQPEIRLALEGLPDGRLLMDEQERLLLYGRRTERYPHGVLGDGYEAGSIFLVETTPEPTILTEIRLPEHEVFEGVSPIWVDFNGDMSREILVTISDRERGAYLALFDERGTLLARSDPIGRPFRWRHQISVGEFAGVEIASVLTPHIGGVLQFHRWEGSQLKLQAEYSNASSHQIGSGNLDMALSGDFDGDGRLEILVPNTSYNVLGIFERDGDYVVLKQEIPLGGSLSTNLAGITLPGGRLAVGLGLADGTVRLWLPE